MEDILQNILIKEFPNLYKQVNLSPQESCMHFGFECGSGWFQIIHDLSKKISELDPTVEAVQVKEKFGGLRFYVGPVNKSKSDEVYESIMEAEKKSFKTCEHCGSVENVSTKGPGWIKTLCNTCRKERSNKKLNDINTLPDIQHESKPEFELYINQVGVENVKVPFLLDSLYGGTHSLIANVEMTTDLRDNIKGISMSMLLRSLIKYLDKPLKHETIKQILEEFKTAVETDSDHSFIKFDFELPINKKAPKSNMVFPQFYKCGFSGKLDHDEFRFFSKVLVQYQSYCPCSASLCNHLKDNGSSGFPHAQRSFCDLLVEVKPENVIWLETLIELIENAVSNRVYPILRRMDEQHVAKIAGENPQFVEDSIRRICNALNKEESIHDYIVKCYHEESLHTSNAIAISWKGIEKGFRGTHYL